MIGRQLICIAVLSLNILIWILTLTYKLIKNNLILIYVSNIWSNQIDIIYVHNWYNSLPIVGALLLHFHRACPCPIVHCRRETWEKVRHLFKYHSIDVWPSFLRHRQNHSIFNTYIRQQSAPHRWTKWSATWAFKHFWIKFVSCVV